MSRAQIVANTKLMLSGGLQEPRDLIALTLWALGREPGPLDEVRADRALVKPAVEETLRWAGPVGTSTRQTTREVELAGVTLPEVALVGAALASANRTRRWTEPDLRPPSKESAPRFAAGTHFCLGAWFGGTSRGSRWTCCRPPPGLGSILAPVTLRG
jgi:cytochrome P450